MHGNVGTLDVGILKDINQGPTEANADKDTIQIMCSYTIKPSTVVQHGSTMCIAGYQTIAKEFHTFDSSVISYSKKKQLPIQLAVESKGG